MNFKDNVSAFISLREQTFVKNEKYENFEHLPYESTQNTYKISQSFECHF